MYADIVTINNKNRGKFKRGNKVFRLNSLKVEIIFLNIVDHANKIIYI